MYNNSIESKAFLSFYSIVDEETTKISIIILRK